MTDLEFLSGVMSICKWILTQPHEIIDWDFPLVNKIAQEVGRRFQELNENN